MTKHKIEMVTMNTPCLVIVIFSARKVVPIVSKENVLSTTITGNVTMFR